MIQREEPLKFLVIGAGQRGIAYARPVSKSTYACIHAVAEPAQYRRKTFGERYIWGQHNEPAEGQSFADWKEWLTWETERRQRHERGETVAPGVDGVFVCTLDESHVEIMCALAPLNLHVLCEKPLATSLADVLAIYQAFLPVSKSKVFSVGHVLRYSPHNLLLRKLLLEDRVIGDILSVEHTEPVGWWHFAHSYVRGNWRRETPNHDGSLLTKCSHDIDFLLWILSQPMTPTSKDTTGSSDSTDSTAIQPHLPRLITSLGSRNQFRHSRKPLAAGTATNCLSCAHERSCQYSAVQIYDDARLAFGYTHWLPHVVHDIEDTLATEGVATARRDLHAALAADYDRSTTPDETIASRPWYGRCVWESDNTVCDDQTVTLQWDEEDEDQSTTPSRPTRPGKMATLHMIANTEAECQRRGVVYGTSGELSYNSAEIRYFDFHTRKATVVHAAAVPEEELKIRSHGGGDAGLANAFVAAVHSVEKEGRDVARAQREHIGCTLTDAVRAHAMVFAAEEARREERAVRWGEWWDRKVGMGNGQ